MSGGNGEGAHCCNTAASCSCSKKRPRARFVLACASSRPRLCLVSASSPLPTSTSYETMTCHPCLDTIIFSVPSNRPTLIHVHTYMPRDTHSPNCRTVGLHHLTRSKTSPCMHHCTHTHTRPRVQAAKPHAAPPPLSFSSSFSASSSVSLSLCPKHHRLRHLSGNANFGLPLSGASCSIAAS